MSKHGPISHGFHQKTSWSPQRREGSMLLWYVARMNVLLLRLQREERKTNGWVLLIKLFIRNRCTGVYCIELCIALHLISYILGFFIQFFPLAHVFSLHSFSAIISRVRGTSYTDSKPSDIKNSYAMFSTSVLAMNCNDCKVAFSVFTTRLKCSKWYVCMCTYC